MNISVIQTEFFQNLHSYCMNIQFGSYITLLSFRIVAASKCLINVLILMIIISLHCRYND